MVFLIRKKMPFLRGIKFYPARRPEAMKGPPLIMFSYVKICGSEVASGDAPEVLNCRVDVPDET